MATRLYPTLRVPGVRIDGQPSGTWGTMGGFISGWSPSQHTWILSPSKASGGRSILKPVNVNQQGNYDVLLWRVMTRPLQAGAISVGATLDLCAQVNYNWRDAVAAPAASSVVRYKVHAYVSVGQTPTVRQVILSNYVDTVDFPFNATDSTVTAQALAAPQTLTAATILAGDCIVIEFGIRIVSSPTPAPTYPVTNYTRVNMRGVGTTGVNNNTALSDLVPGSGTIGAPWVEFSDTLTEQAAPAPHSNETCATALQIASLPHTSNFLNVTGGVTANQDAYWQWTAEASGRVFFHTLGGNYRTFMQVSTGACGSLTPVAGQQGWTTFAQHRSMTVLSWVAVQGTTYTILVQRNDGQVPTGFAAPAEGGALRLSGSFADTPAVGDVYVAAGWVVCLRDGVMKAVNPTFDGNAPTGVAIDYTRRAMVSAFDSSTNTDERLHVGLHAVPIVEILRLPNLSWPSETEVDFLSDPFINGAVHPAQIQIDADGNEYVAWYGDGYLFTCGVGSQLVSHMNTVSNTAAVSAIRKTDSTFGDNQPAAPFPSATQYTPTVEVTAPWAILLDAAAGVIYYTSAGLYTPVGGQTIRKFTIATQTDVLFATLSASGGQDDGLKGLCRTPDGGFLVCNGQQIVRLSSGGVVTQTYTPSVASKRQSLVDVRLTPDGTKFWTIDLVTATLFQFNLATGAELQLIDTYLLPSGTTQLAVYGEASPVSCPAQPDIDAVTEEGDALGGFSVTQPWEVNQLGVAATLNYGVANFTAPFERDAGASIGFDPLDRYGPGTHTSPAEAGAEPDTTGRDARTPPVIGAVT